MVEAGGEIDAAGAVRDVDGEPGADAVGEDRDRERDGNKGEPPLPAAVTDIGDERAECSHGDQELHAGAGLRHLEIAGRGGDEDALEVGGNVGDRQHPCGDLCSRRLHRRDQLLPERHQKQGEEERKRDCPGDIFPEEGDHRALQHEDQPEMTGGGDRACFTEHPAECTSTDSAALRGG